MLDGQPVVGFAEVSKTKTSSEVTVENEVDATIDKIKHDNPGLAVHKVVSYVDFTRAGFTATLHTLLEGMALAALVVWLFPARLAGHGDHRNRHAGVADPDLHIYRTYSVSA